MIPVFPEREIEVCLGCESRGPAEDLDSDGLCAECREMTHISLGPWPDLLDDIEKGPMRRSCDCPACWAHFKAVDRLRRENGEG